MSYHSLKQALKAKEKVLNSLAKKNRYLFPLPEDIGKVTAPWSPIAKLPQLEELIEAFHTTGIPVAGGAVLASFAAVGYEDIDVFPVNELQLEKTKQILTEQLGYRLEEDLEHAANYEHPSGAYRKLQVVKIHIDCNDPYEVIRRFDLSICQIAVIDKMLLSTTVALEDINSRILRCMGTISLHSFMHRVEKYRGRGFKLADLPNAAFR